MPAASPRKTFAAIFESLTPLASLTLFVSLTLFALPAQAAEVTRVVSAFDDDNSFDLNLTASWTHQVKSASIKRESESDLASGIELLRDLKYAETRDVLDLRLDFGVLWDVGLHVEAPLVLGDSNRLNFDQSGCPDVTGMRPTCVDAGNSTLLRDGILPGFGQSSYGLDAAHGGRAFMAPSSQVFQSPTRSGFQDLGVGVTWAVFNQHRDDTKPTWTLGFDAKLDVFKDMRFDPANPGANTAVGLGYHQLVWSTWVSKRFRHLDPYFGAYYMLPIRTNGSIFQDQGGGQTSVNPQQEAGFSIGTEIIAWENPRHDQRITIEARGHVDEHFSGRGYSELWEPLAGSPSTCVPGSTDLTNCRPGLDENIKPPAPGTVGATPVTQAAPYPGVTDIESYATFGGDLGLNVEVGRYVRFRGLFGLSLDMPHFITDANAGIPGADDRVDSNSSEANPVYRESLDIPGRRFRVEDTEIWTLLVEGSFMF